jgi:hypothetical protein
MHPRVVQGFDRLLSVHRPAVLMHIRTIRRSKPDATPDQVIASLERRFKWAVTGGGAAVGAAPPIPPVGTGVSLALSGADTVGFLEATALFAQSVSEVHGVPLDDPERARALVMGLMLGGTGQELLQQFAGQAAGRGTRAGYWGEVVTKQLPGPAFNMVADRIRSAFIKRFAATQGTSAVGRLIPFGIGAAIGGVGNHVLARGIISASREAFGPVPVTFPETLGFVPKPPKAPRTARGPRLLRAPRVRKGAPEIPPPPKQLEP